MALRTAQEPNLCVLELCPEVIKSVEKNKQPQGNLSMLFSGAEAKPIMLSHSNPRLENQPCTQ